MSKTQLMGILNATPDSFYDKSRFFEMTAAVARGHQMVAEGADILDVGGESTRPGAPAVSLEEEIKRVIPLIRRLKQELSIPISIDTMKPQVAAKAIEAGATWINDVGGFRDSAMHEIAASAEVKLCVMHMQGTPQTMQKAPSYEASIIDYLKYWFSDIINTLIQSGVKEHNIVLDPGIGFGKTVAHNLEIIHNLAELKKLGFPVLIGVSRKSFMGKILNRSTDELLPATLAINSVAILSHVDFIRVHDIQAHRDIIDLLSIYNK
ncbi:Dihydropteroate synthase [Neochlamydia sp. EPS4]|uniref:dihydropteroate synthase n=1 Tax=Neochlamydia sp. EPS4 TaxID=1478175 RepID=UPI000583ACA3|nr:dihydropteroate synthase [Neochlamydia sp. EPS4]KIC72311.1 Dihydropteroate synthase [Neochlamydia sp. EPS4]